MKSNLHNLTFAFGLLLAGLGLYYGLSFLQGETQMEAQLEAQEAGQLHSNPLGGNSPAAAEIKAAAEKLTHLPWSATVRLKGSFSGETVESVGDYQQLGGVSDAIKLNLKFQLDGSVDNVFSQTSDGRYIYTQRNYQDHVSLEHVDLGRVRRILALHKRDLPIAFAGVPKLMESLAEFYNWNPAPLAAGSNSNVHRFVGSRKPRVGPVDNTSPISVLPSSVDLVISADANHPFPIRLEFYETSKQGERRTTLLAELHDIRLRQDLQLSNFEFDPGENALIDATDEYLQQFALPEPVVAEKGETSFW